MTLEIRELALAVAIKGRPRTLLEPFSFRAPAGASVGLTGPSGAGKSTVLRLIVGLDQRSKGRVLLDGHDVTDWPRFRRNVVLIPQRLPASPMTLLQERDRIDGFTGAKVPDTRIKEELELLALGPDIAQQPLRDLSGGEQRRAWIALTLARDPRFLLLDEPGFGLDRRAQDLLGQRLNAYRERGGGLVLASHDERLLATCCRQVFVFFDGVVQAGGPLHEILPAALNDLRDSRP